MRNGRWFLLFFASLLFFFSVLFQFVYWIYFVRVFFSLVHTSFGKPNTLTYQVISFCVCLRNGTVFVVDVSSSIQKNDIDFKHSMTGTTVLNHTLSHRHLMLSFFFLFYEQSSIFVAVVAVFFSTWMKWCELP